MTAAGVIIHSQQFNMEDYTTKLDKQKLTKEQIDFAERMAAEIENESVRLPARSLAASLLARRARPLAPAHLSLPCESRCPVLLCAGVRNCACGCVRSPCIKYGLPPNMMALITSGCVRSERAGSRAVGTKATRRWSLGSDLRVAASELCLREREGCRPRSLLLLDGGSTGGFAGESRAAARLKTTRGAH